ncbi:hypothetical protein [Variovorax sp. PAMC 28711]|uniref:hypothetical protein n=1 Tax=Variovorax sp. PAMC 28711 TaxID=1795631 RepID=UPI00078B3B89|nr:hypothetical protein [Variovorax sp. PAMC 28711]AMM23660.1 hypothetical protein AX767_04355 [Variovorax sp. PAMC 28711]
MWLYLHHTGSDIIDLDSVTGRWRQVDDAEKPSGAMVLADLPIKGSYTIEDGKRYFTYWTSNGRFVFRTDEGLVFEVCQKRPDGSIMMLEPALACEITPSRYGDGRLRQGFSQMRLINATSDTVSELEYNSERFMRFYQSDFTAAAAVQDLSDWDFFVALQGAFGIFNERAASGRVAFTVEDDGTAQVQGRSMHRDELVFADTGQPCPKSGVWACMTDLRVSAVLTQGEAMPSNNGQSVQWVWSRPD